MFLFIYLVIIYLCSSGWKTALETITANSRPVVVERERDTGPANAVDPQLLADMNSKWSRTEMGLRSEIDILTNKVSRVVGW